MTCFIHPDREAVKEANVPCAPNGKLPLCEECAQPESAQMVFDHYIASHGKRVQLFKGVKGNPGN